MAKHMDAEAITDAVYKLEETAVLARTRDIIETLSEDGWKQDSDPDTWATGFAAAIAVIKGNYIH